MRSTWLKESIFAMGLTVLPVSAMAIPFELGVGIQPETNAIIENKIPGLRASARMEHGVFGFQFVALARPGSIKSSDSGLWKTLLNISQVAPSMGSDFAVNVSVERAMFALNADWGFGRRAPVDEWAAGPRLHIGVEGRLRDTARGSSGNESGLFQIEHTGLKFNVGPNIGASVDIWWQKRFGLRLGLHNRLYFERVTLTDFEEREEMTVRHQLGLSLDLLFATKGEK